MHSKQLWEDWLEDEHSPRLNSDSVELQVGPAVVLLRRQGPLGGVVVAPALSNPGLQIFKLVQ